VFESLRRHGAKEAVLVGWCIASDGRKHLLHLAVGNKEHYLKPQMIEKKNNPRVASYASL
jgi:hypothetical protein